MLLLCAFWPDKVLFPMDSKNLNSEYLAFMIVLRMHESR